MKTETKILGIILLLTLILLFGGVLFLSKSSNNNPKSIIGTTVYDIDYSLGQKIGTDSAKVKIAEFSDFECPACAAAVPYVNKLKNDYAGQIQLIYLHFPLTQHTHSRQAATVAEAAAEQGKFWEMHDKLFETQAQWTKLTDANPFFLDLARQLGLDEAKIKNALEKDAYQGKIETSIAEGIRVKVNATPSFYLNGRKLNLRSFSDLNTIVAEEFKK